MSKDVSSKKCAQYFLQEDKINVTRKTGRKKVKVRSNQTTVHNTCPHINAETLLEFMGELGMGF